MGLGFMVENKLIYQFMSSMQADALDDHKSLARSQAKRHPFGQM